MSTAQTPIINFSNFGDPTPVPVASEMLINAPTSVTEYNTVITKLSDGYVVAWNSNSLDGSGSGVFLQRFTEGGAKTGPQLQVNTTTNDNQLVSDIAALPGGGFVVVWDDRDGAVDDIRLRLYDGNGTPQTGEVLVSASQIGDHQTGTVIVNTDGSFAIVWQAMGPVGSGTNAYDIGVQKFTSAGVEDGPAEIVNSTAALDQSRPDSLGLSDGRGFVVWASDNGTTSEIRGRFLDGMGNPIGSGDFLVSPPTAANRYWARAEELNDGTLVVTWMSTGGEDGDSSGIFARHFDSNGAPLADQFVVNSVTSFHQEYPSVVATPDGGFVIVWRSFEPSVSEYDVFGQRFDASAQPVGDQFLINQTTLSSQHTFLESSIILDNGDLVATWSGNGSGDTLGVLSRTFSLPDAAIDIIDTSSGLEIPLELALNDTDDGGETLSLTLTGYPAGSTFNVPGTDNAGVFTVTDPENLSLNFLRITVPETFVGTFTITAEATATEISSGTMATDTSIITFNIIDPAARPDVSYSGGPDATPMADGGEELVNTTVGKRELEARVVALDDGHVVVWYELDANLTDGRIVARLYGTDGNAKGGPFVVNTVGVNSESLHDVKALPNGGFIAVYDGVGVGFSDIFARRFDASGSPIGAEQAVNTVIDGFEARPGVLVKADGSYTVYWAGLTNGVFEMRAQAYDAAGSADGGETVFFTAGANRVDTPEILALDGGGFFLTYARDRTAETQVSGFEALGQFLNASGVAVGDPIQLSPDGVTSRFFPKAVELSDGTIAVTYEASTTTGDRNTYIRLFDSNGDPLTGEFLARSGDNNFFFETGIIALPEGGFVLTWYEDADDGTVLAQRFSNTGAEVGQPFVIHETTAGSQDAREQSLAVVLSDGRLIAAWHGEGNGDNAGAFTRTFTLPDPTTEVVNTDGLIPVPLSAALLDNDGSETLALTITGYPAGATFNVAGTEDNGVFTITDLSQAAPANLVMTVGTGFTGDFDLTIIATATETATGDTESETNIISFSVSHPVAEAPSISLGISGPGITPDPLTNDMLVTDETPSFTQANPAAAKLADGYIIVWTSEVQDVVSGNGGVYARRYDNDGNPLGGQFLVNEPSVNDQEVWAVEGFPDGGFVIAWRDILNTDEISVFARAYGADGVPRGDQFQVETNTANQQQDPSIATYSDGSFLIAWHSVAFDAGDVQAQRYDASGMPQGTEFTIPEFSTGQQQYFSVLGLQNDRTLAMWYSADSRPDSVYGRFIEANGSFAPEGEFAIDVGQPISGFWPKAAELANGSIIVTWRSNDDSSAGVYAQKISATGALIGDAVLVNTETANSQSRPSITPLEDGGYLIIWMSQGQDGSAEGIYGQRFDANSNPLGDEFRLNDTTSGTQRMELESLITLDGDRILATWVGNGPGDSSGVFTRTFSLPEEVLQDQDILIPIDAALTDTDGDETLSIVLSGFPDGTTFNLGTAGPGAGEWTVTTNGAGLDLSAFFMTPPLGFTGTFTLQVEAIATEPVGGDTASTIAIHPMSVFPPPVADAPTAVFTDALSDLTPMPSAGEQLVNSTTADLQIQPVIAKLTDGYVIVWSSYNQDTGVIDYGVFGQRYNEDGSTNGAEFQVNTNTADDQYVRDVAARPDGGFVVVWEDRDVPGDSIAARVFDANGAPADLNTDGSPDAEIQLTATQSGNHYQPSAVVYDDGSFLIVWHDPTGDGDVRMQKFTAAGTEDGPSEIVNSDTAGFQYLPDAQVLSGGRTLVTWSSNTGSDYEIRGRILDANGAFEGVEFAISPGGDGIDRLWPRAAELTDGTLLVTWYSFNNEDGSGYAVLARHLDANGAPLGAQFQVNTTTASSQYFPAIAALPDGGFVIAWRSETGDGFGHGVFGQRFDAAAQPVGGEFLINETTDFDQITIHDALIVLQNGDLLATWSGTGVDSETGTVDSSGVFSRAFSLPEAVVRVEAGLNQPIPVALAAALTDMDGSETLEVVLSDFPAGSTFNLGDTGPNPGEWTIPDPQNVDLTTLEITLPDDFIGTFDLRAEVTATETIGGDTATTTATLPVDIFAPEADAPTAVFDHSLMDLTPQGLPSEQRLNSDTAHSQLDSTLAKVPGGYVAVWTTVIGSAPEIRAQIYPETGPAITSAFVVEQNPGSIPTQPDVASFADGSFVIVWRDVSDNTVRARVFEADGSQKTGELNVTGALPDSAFNPVVTTYGDDDTFLVIWQTSISGSAPNFGDIRGQKFESDGTPLPGGDFVVNEVTDTLQRLPDAITLSDGRTLVTWNSTDNGLYEIRGRFLDENGNIDGGEFQISPSGTYERVLSQAAELVDGTLVVAWQSVAGEDGDGNAVYAQRLAADGSQIGSQFLVNTTTAFNQQNASIVALPDGGFVVSWISFGTDGSSNGVYGQRYDDEANAIGDEFRINVTTSGSQSSLRDSLIVFEDGSLFSTWFGEGPGDNTGVFAREFVLPPTAVEIPAGTGDAVAIPLDAELTDIDGSETLEVVLTGFPDGATFSIGGAPAGSLTAPGIWTIPDAQNFNFANLEITLPVDFEGTFELQAAVTATEGVGGDSATTIATLPINVFDATADIPTIAFDDAPADLSPQPLTGEMLITDESPSFPQQDAIIEKLAGGYVVVWRAISQDDESGKSNVFFQIYDDDGNKRPGTSETRVNDVTANNQILNSVVATADGGFVVAFQDDNTERDVFAQRFDDNGNALGDNFKVNAEGAGPQAWASLGVFSDDSLLATWQSALPLQGIRIKGQIYDPAGNVVVPEFDVASSLGTLDQRPDVLILSDDRALVTWTKVTSPDSQIQGRIVNADGTFAGPDFAISPAETGNPRQKPHAAELADGSIIVAWTSEGGEDGSNDGVYAQKLGSDGTLMGSQFLVNASNTIADQKDPAVQALPDGGFVIIYTSDGLTLGGDDNVIIQRYDAAAQPVGDPVRANVTLSGEQRAVEDSVIVLDNGQLLVGWSGNGADVDSGQSDSAGVFARVFDLPGEIAVNDVTGPVPTAIAVPITAALGDTDGSESLAIVLTGFPDGTVFSEGAAGDPGEWIIENAQALDLSALNMTLPTGFLGSFTLSATAVSTESSSGATASSAPVTLTFAIGLSNQAPAFADIDSGSTFVEDGPAVVIETAGTVSDVNYNVLNGGDGDYAGLVLTVERAGGADAGDVFGFETTGAPFTVSGNTLIDGAGDAFAAFSLSGGTLEIIFTGLEAPATTALTHAVVQAVTFSNPDDTPPATVDITWTARDDDGATGTATASIAITPVNDDPVVEEVDGSTVSWSETSGAVRIIGSANPVVADVDSEDFDGGSLTVSYASGQLPEDRLFIAENGDFSLDDGVGLGESIYYNGNPVAEFGAGTGGENETLEILFTDSEAGPFFVEDLLKAINYNNAAGNNPTPGDRTLSIVLADGDGGTSAVSGVTVGVTADNDAPVIFSLDGDAADFAEDGSAVFVDTGAPSFIVDPDSPDLDGGVLTIAYAQNQSPDDRLVIDLGALGLSAGQTGGSEISFAGNVVGTIRAGATGGANENLIVDLSGANASPLAIQDIIRAIRFDNVDDANPSELVRTLTATVTDGDGGTSDPVTFTVGVMRENDAPTANLEDGPRATDDITPISLSLTVDDVDSDTLDVLIQTSLGTLSVAAPAQGSTVSVNGDGTTAVGVVGNKAEVQQVLDGLTFNPEMFVNGVATIDVFLQDDQGEVAQDFLDIDVAFSDTAAPVVSIPATPPLETNEDTPFVFSLANGNAISVADQQETLSVAILADGELALGSTTNLQMDDGDGSDGTLSFSGSKAAINAAFNAGLTFTPFSNANGLKTFSFTVADDYGLSNPTNPFINVLPVNDDPFFDGVDGATSAWAEGDGAIQLIGGATPIVSDVDSPDFNGGRLTVSITNVALAEDRLLVNEGGAFALASGMAAGSVVSFNGAPIGEIVAGSTGTGAENLEILFTSANATPAATAALIGAVQYINDGGNNPTVGNRTVSVIFDDGDGGVSGSADVTVSVGAENDAPVLMVVDQDYSTDDLTPVSILASVADPDSSDVRVTLSVDSGVITLGDVAGIATVNFFGGTSLEGAQDILLFGDIGEINEALAGLTFTPDQFFSGTETLTLGTGDGDANGDDVTVDIPVVFSDLDDPLITIPDGLTTAEDTPFDITGVSVADAQATGNITLLVTEGAIALGTTTGLTFTDADGSDGTLAFNGTFADMNAALAAGISYTPVADQNGTFNLRVDAQDLYGNSANLTKTVTITPVNDDPVVADLDGKTLTFTEGDPPLGIASDSTIDVSDIDSVDFANGNLTLTFRSGGLPEDQLVIGSVGNISLSGGMASGSEVLHFGSAIGTIQSGGTPGGNLIVNFNAASAPSPAAVEALINAIRYENTGGDNPTAGVRELGLTIGDGDGGTSAVSVFTIGVEPENDAPDVVVSQPVGGTDDVTPLGLTASVVDPDSASVTLELTTAAGTLTFGDVSGLSAADGVGTGAVTLEGSVAALNTALTGLTFTPDQFFAGDAEVTITSTDGTDAGATETITIPVVISDTAAPVVAPDFATNTPEDTQLGLLSFTVDDEQVSLDITLAISSGALVLEDTTGLTMTDADGSDGTLAFSGLVFDINAALAGGVTYTPPLNQFGVQSLALTATDIYGNAATTNVEIVVDPVNDRPVFTDLGSTPNPLFTRGQPAIVLDGDVVVSDVELDAASNYAGAVFAIQRSTLNADDVFTLAAMPTVSVSGSDLLANGSVIATVAQLAGGLQIFFTDATGEIPTQAIVNEVLQAVQYLNANDNPPASVDLNWTFDDGTEATTETATVDIFNPNRHPVVEDDAFTISELGTIADASVLADNGSGPDTDADIGDVLTVSHINGADYDTDTPFELPSGALLTMAADGTFTYDPNGEFEFVPVGETATDSFTYRLFDGLDPSEADATVTVTLTGEDNNDIVVGTPGPDSFVADLDDDQIDGLGDIDTITYAEPLTVEAIGPTGSWQVTTLTQGTDTLRNVEIIVDSDGNRFLLVGSEGFTSIGAAVAAAQAGDTILVAPGTYAEAVTVDKAVILKGAQAGVAGHGAARSVPGAAESTIVGGLLITADGASVDGFTLQDGASFTGFSPTGTALAVAADDVGIANVIATRGIPTDLDGSRGVEVASGSGLNLVVGGSLFTGWDTAVLAPSAPQGRILDNHLIDNVIGILNEGPDLAEIAGNTIQSRASNISLGASGDPVDLALVVGLNTLVDHPGTTPTDVAIDPRGPDGQTILGTAYDDTVFGDVSRPNDRQVIDGRGGDDDIRTGGGDDEVSGGTGDDTIDTGAGNDRIVYLPGHGSDTIDGGANDDVLVVDGSASLVPVLYTLAGNGTTSILEVNDVFAVQSTFTGVEDVELLLGGHGDAVILVGDLAASGVSTSTIAVTGGAGADLVDASLMTAPITVSVSLMGGNDVFISGPGDDMADGGDGLDLFVLGDNPASGSGGTIDVAAGTATDAFGRTDTFSDFEGYLGSDGDDTLSGSAADELLAGGDGNDGITGGNGTNILLGGDGVDTITGGDDTDLIDDGDGNDTVDGGDGDDIILAADGSDTIDGGEGFDVFSLWPNSSFGALVNLQTGFAFGGQNSSFIDTLTGIEGVLGSGVSDLIVGADNVSNTVFASGGDDFERGGATSGDGTDVNTYDASIAANGYLPALLNGVSLAALRDLDPAEVATLLANIDGLETAPPVPTSVAVDLQTGVAAGAAIGTNQITEFQNVTGGDGSDQLFGDAGANVLIGNGGDDLLIGREGDDRIDGGAGEDIAGFGTQLFNPDGSLAVTLAVTADGNLEISDPTAGGFGTDTISGIELLAGSDPGMTLVVGAGSEFATLQAAIDAASAGQTILVVGDVLADTDGVAEINKALTIIGVKAGVAGTDAARGTGESTIDGRLKITADDVTLDGLAFIDYRDTSTTALIEADGVKALTIQNMRFELTGTLASLGEPITEILLDDVDGASITDTFITRSTLAGPALPAGVVLKDSGDVAVRDNTIIGTRIDVDGQSAASIAAAKTTTIADNTVTAPIDDDQAIVATAIAEPTLLVIGPNSLGGDAGVAVESVATTATDFGPFDTDGDDLFTGTALDDTAVGGDGDDRFIGNDGDDTFTGGKGRNTFEGGDGVDTALYTVGTGGNSINDTGSSWNVTTQQAFDTLTGVEIVEFTTGRVLLVGSGGFATLGDAVAEAQPGDSIFIARTARLAEVVDVNVDQLAILAVPGAVLTGALNITADDVLVRGLTVETGAVLAGFGTAEVGIGLQGNNTVLSAVTVDGTGASTIGSVIGIAASTTSLGHRILDSEIKNWITGINDFGAGVFASINDNTFDRNQNGIITGDNTASIGGNDFKNGNFGHITIATAKAASDIGAIVDGTNTFDGIAPSVRISANGPVGQDIEGTVFEDTYSVLTGAAAGARTFSGDASRDTATGGVGADLLFGEGGDDILNGADGDDALFGGAGNDQLDGGDDIDVIAYAGDRAGYTIDLVNGTISDTNLADGDDGTDTFTNVEAFQFADARVLIAGTGGASFATLQAALDAASPGDTIILGPGVLAADGDGQAVITKAGITLLGAFAGTAGTDGARGTGESVIAGQIRVEADTVTIDGIAFTDYAGPAPVPGIDVVGATNTTLANLLFTLDAGSPAGTSGTEINLDTANGATVTGVLVDRSGFAAVPGNTVSAPAIQSSNALQAIVTQSTLVDATIGITGDAPGGVTSTVAVTGNTITPPAGVTSAIAVAGLEDLSAITIAPNALTAPAGVAVDGTLLADDLTGFATGGDDTFQGRDGGDTLRGLSGDDILRGDAGDDTLQGDAGADRIEGGAGDDTILYGLGDGSDSMDGGADDDALVVTGSAATAAISYTLAQNGATLDITVDDGVQPVTSNATSVEDVVISFGAFGDTLTLIGDLLAAGVSPNTITVTGGAGNDLIDASALTGGVGMVASLGGGDDTVKMGVGDHNLDGGVAGFDTLDFGHVATSVTVNLANGFAAGTTIGINVVSNFEAIRGGLANDSITGDAGDTTIFASIGSDTIDGGGGSNTYHAGDQTGGVVIDLAAGQAVISGFIADTLTNIQNAVGGTGNDVLAGTTGDNRFEGGGGNDTANGGGGMDTFVLSGNRAGYTITDLGGGSYRITDINLADGNDGTDMITDMAFVEFADRTIDPSLPPAGTGRDDLDGAGFSDIVFKTGTPGNYEGVSGGDGSLIRNFTQANNTIIGIADLDGQGGEDLLFTSSASGGHFWIDSGTGTVTPIGLPQFDILSVNDLDGDGQMELLARSKGASAAYSIFDTAGTLETVLGYGPHDLVGVGNVDGTNAGLELLFVNSVNDALFSVSAVTGARLNPAIVNTGIQDFKGLADINGGGVDEVILERVSNGSTAAVDGNGVQVSNFGRAGQPLEAIGDFNGDGIDDLVFDRGADFVVTGGNKSFYNVIGTGAHTIVGVGNYDGSPDGSDDLLFLTATGDHVSANAITDATIVTYGRNGNTALVNDILNTGIDPNDTDILLG